MQYALARPIILLHFFVFRGSELYPAIRCRDDVGVLHRGQVPANSINFAAYRTGGLDGTTSCTCLWDLFSLLTVFEKR